LHHVGVLINPMHYKYVCRRVYKLTWQTWAKPYLGIVASRLKTMFDEQQRYIRTHNAKSAYTVHMLSKAHEADLYMKPWK